MSAEPSDINKKREENIAKILSQYAQPGQPVRVRIEGALPGFLMHSQVAKRLNEEAAAEAKASGLRGKFIPTPEVEAEWGCYRTDDGYLYLPTRNILRSLVEAGKAFKQEKSRSSLKYAVAAGVTVPLSAGNGFLLLNPETKKPITEYTIDIQRAVVQRAAVDRARGLVESWASELEFLIDTQALSLEQFAMLLAHAGSRVGVGDQRPEKGGQYGRFQVMEFHIET